MIKVGIIGTGNIGTDLLLKVIRSDFLEPVIFSGRRMDSDGISIAIKYGIPVTDMGIEYFIKNPKICEVVFDCTNANDAIKHSLIFSEQGIKVIDMTPAKVGELCVPSINADIIKYVDNVNMITCGGQASLPLLNVISKYCDVIDYAEVVSQISSNSAGMATRINIDNYIHTTEDAIKKFTNTDKCKVILNLNPANPHVDMQTTIFSKCKNVNFESMVSDINTKITELKMYIPYYELVVNPTIIDGDILMMSVRVTGVGDYLPKYAGNLDIINCAAIEVLRGLI
jgi:acetaldehyde dehydrogenase (acetylating)